MHNGAIHIQHLYSTGSSETMQFLCIAALLLVAVAARPDSQKPWQKNKFPPIGGPRPDFKPGDNKHVIKSPEDRVAGSGGDSSEWSHETTGFLNRPSKVPGKENPQGPIRGDDGSDHQPGKPSQASNRGKRQAPAFGVMTDEPGVPRPGPGRHFGRPRGPPREQETKTHVLTPFQVNNVTFQNITDVPLKEGENIFLLPKHGRSRPHHHKGGKRGPPQNEQYLKLIYNVTEPDTFSIEYGVLKPINIGELFGEEDNLEDDY
ncbi:hypothetical protein PAMP_021107 [Pampus punctatissimus]